MVNERVIGAKRIVSELFQGLCYLRFDFVVVGDFRQVRFELFCNAELKGSVEVVDQLEQESNG